MYKQLDNFVDDVDILLRTTGISRQVHEPYIPKNTTKYLNECIKTTYLSSDGTFLDKFKHELQGGQTYLKGIYYRGEEIGERYLLKNINFFPGDIIYDCGANLGDLLLWFQNRQLKISYRAFEP